MRLHFSGELSRQKRAIWVRFAIAAERFHGVDVAAKKDRTRCRKLLVAAAEFTRLHIVLQHADAGFRVVEARDSNLVEEDEIA